ncbi:MAG: hypothetical protein IJB59_13820 [Oscillospiraceae bacterium]|nr:hypothetical protein [Oscillospiraceae bacterium]
MKNETVYESHISTARWLAYDVPGNVGWIMYLVCLIQCFVKWPAFMEIPLVWLSVMVGIIPAVAMVVGIAELVSERILKLDRILPKKRLYRGFGALTQGGLGGIIVGLNALTAGLRAGLSVEECKLLILLAVGGALCALFAGLIFNTFHPRKQEE